MNSEPCSITGCTKPVKGRGWCGQHYERWLKNGDPLKARRYTRDPVERFERDVIRGPGCWTWKGNHDPSGYARMSAGGAHKTMKTATWAYEHFVGPTPDGAHLDHKCHTNDSTCAGGVDCPHRGCVNPWHLEPVTGEENVARGLSPTAENARKTHCPQGHPYDAANTYRRPGGGRACRICRAASTVRWNEKARKARASL